MARALPLDGMRPADARPVPAGAADTRFLVARALFLACVALATLFAIQ